MSDLDLKSLEVRLEIALKQTQCLLLSQQEVSTKTQKLIQKLRRRDVLLQKAVETYRCVWNNDEIEKNRQNLLDVFQNNDFREEISKCMEGDDVSDAFVIAGDRNHRDILQAFIDRGMNIDIKNQSGNTALIKASGMGNEKSVRLLLNQNAKADHQTNEKWTALMHASGHGYKEIVKMLLDHNVNIDLKNNEGKTAVNLAWNKEIKEMIQNHVNTSYVLK